MIGLRAIVKGHDKIDAKLQRVGGHVAEQLAPEMRQAITYVHSQVPGYPAPPATSTYRRTGTLGRSVTSFSATGALSRVESVGSGVVGYVGTNIDYAGYVIDEERQAYMHRGRWWTLQNVVRGAAGGIVRILEAGVRRIVS